VDKLALLVGAFVALTSIAYAAPPAAPTFQELMDPTLFPDPQRGMTVESAGLRGEAVSIETTGAEIDLDCAKGEAVFRQRIGHQRPLVTLHLGRPLTGGRVTHSGPGFARVVFETPRATVRVNGDSLFMLHAHEPLAVTVERRIESAWNSSFGANHLIADELGAFGLYCSERGLDDHFDPYSETLATYRLPADSVLWVAVCPPKPYDWERSFKDNVVWHWSNQLGYPPDETLRSWQPHGNTVLLQSEVMLWKDWNLDFVPRLGADEFARVRETIHRLGMRFIVYTSPYYFLKGTTLENRALNSFDNFKGWPPGTPTGENMELFLAAITRVMQEYQPDGLYFDGQYLDNPAALYALARRAREIVGEPGILEWHSTGALGGEHCYLPQADAYVDFVLRGEGVQSRYGDFDYLRFFVSGYNVSNSIGVLCNNAGGKPTPALTGELLRANARYHTIAGWLADAGIMDVLKNQYQARLNPDLRLAVDREADARQAKVAEKAAATRAERQALATPPAWGEPVLAEGFDKLPAAEQLVSPANPTPFSVVDGCLRTRGPASTFAFLKQPVKTRASGLVVKIRHGTDGGMSWGPAAAVRWQDGSLLRLGTRSDAKMQADILGRQSVGSTVRPDRWIWLRARWLRRTGVVERSDDGVTYERVWTFEHGGTLNGPIAELLIGKVPFNGDPTDYTDPGPVGESDIDFVHVYGQ
jgi:hypothetical protein